MKVLVFGATGRTGRLAVAALKSAGHDVEAFHRRDVPGVTTHVAAFDDHAALRAALDGVDAVVSTLASSQTDPVCSSATKALIAASDGRALRYVTVAGAAVEAPGDQKALPDRIVGGIMRLVVGRMLADRQAELGLLQRCALAWTMLRPPRLTDGPATGRITWTFDTPASTKLSRADLAQALVQALGRDDTIGRAPFVAEAKS